jgi:hypothetical protein
MKDLLSHTESLFNHIYWFKQDFGIKPKKEHYGSAINWTDISERKEQFVAELMNTITSWVYNKANVKKIVDDRLALTGDLGNATNHLTNLAYSKFRKERPQGQFGELLLFNFMQHFFEAVPLLRKQPITTTTGMERFGADAIHYKPETGANILYLGESKCYESKYKFKSAFGKAVESISTTFTSIDNELNLYVHDGFIEPRLEEVAKKYKAGTLEHVRFELVCLIAYNESEALTKTNEDEIKKSIQKVIVERCASLEDKDYGSCAAHVLDRVNFIVFPIWELDALLETFQNSVGAK